MTTNPAEVLCPCCRHSDVRIGKEDLLSICFVCGCTWCQSKRAPIPALSPKDHIDKAIEVVRIFHAMVAEGHDGESEGAGLHADAVELLEYLGNVYEDWKSERTADAAQGHLHIIAKQLVVEEDGQKELWTGFQEYEPKVYPSFSAAAKAIAERALPLGWVAVPLATPAATPAAAPDVRGEALAEVAVTLCGRDKPVIVYTTLPEAARKLPSGKYSLYAHPAPAPLDVEGERRAFEEKYGPFPEFNGSTAQTIWNVRLDGWIARARLGGEGGK
jgi:hypothetical protein